MTSPNPQEGGKHTPGPWRMNRHGNLAGSNGAAVGVWNAGLTNVHRGPEAEANARLIAAAPALPEALQALYDDYKQLADSGDAGFWRLEDCDVGKQAMAALLQATGGENGR